MLYRTNAQSRVVEESFVQAGIRYRMYGGLKFYDRKEVKDILAYLRALVNSGGRHFRAAELSMFPNALSVIRR